MRELLLLIGCILACCIASCSTIRPGGNDVRIFHPSPVDSQSSLQKEIGSVLDDSALSGCIIGIKVISLDRGTVLFERNSANLFHPASNMKVITTAVGLDILGQGFQFHTLVSTDTPATNGILHGDLYVKGFGDPLLKTGDLDSLAAQIHDRGIRIIEGDIVGDVTYFDTLSWGKGWMWDDEPDPDEPFITPLTLNANSIEILVAAGKETDDPITVTLNPPTDCVRIVNTGTCSHDTTLRALTVTRTRGANTILVTGRIAPRTAEQSFVLSVRQPELIFLDVLKQKLVGRGIVVHGTVRRDTAKGRTPVTGVVHTLDSVLYQINKQSYNLGAELLLKTLASTQRGVPGTTADGLAIVKEYLYRAGIDTTRMILADGSGVSWYTLLSPAAMIQLLQHQYQKKEFFRTYYESLPIAGVDGTLKSRMKGTKAAGNVRGKTGTLTGESCISGYVTSIDGSMLAFSIFCNHFPHPISPLRDIQDRILEILANCHVKGQ